MVKARILAKCRQWRVSMRQWTGSEPTVEVTHDVSLEYHGSQGYGGWAVPVEVVEQGKCVVDVGLGDNVEFSESLMRCYNYTVHGFDPTPKALAHLSGKCDPRFVTHPCAVGGENQKRSFFLPNNTAHVSGSLYEEAHLGGETIEVEVLDMKEVFGRIGRCYIDILKVDIEGAEYDLIASSAFEECSANVGVFCVEFHHRWARFGRRATEEAVKKLTELGFVCVWASPETNEEFTFMNVERMTKLAIKGSR